MTCATSSASIGDVHPAPKGSRIVESLAIDSAAQAEKKKFWRKNVARTSQRAILTSSTPARPASAAAAGENPYLG